MELPSIDIPALPGIAGGVGAAILMLSLYRSVSGEAARVGDRNVLAYGRPARWAIHALWALVAVTVAFGPTPASGDLIPLALLVAAMCSGLLVLSLEIFIVRVEYDDQALRTFSPWRRSRVIPWSAIRSAWYSPALSWHVIETDGKGRVHLHDFINGVPDLLEQLRRRGLPVKTRGQR